MYVLKGKVGVLIERTVSKPPLPRCAPMAVELTGQLRPGVTGKDVIIALCGHFNKDEVLNHAVEFTGEGMAFSFALACPPYVACLRVSMLGVALHVRCCEGNVLAVVLGRPHALDGNHRRCGVLLDARAVLGLQLPMLCAFTI